MVHFIMNTEDHNYWQPNCTKPLYKPYEYLVQIVSRYQSNFCGGSGVKGGGELPMLHKLPTKFQVAALGARLIMAKST